MYGNWLSPVDKKAQVDKTIISQLIKTTQRIIINSYNGKDYATGFFPPYWYNIMLILVLFMYGDVL